jgi:hypothetical protein
MRGSGRAAKAAAMLVENAEQGWREARTLQWLTTAETTHDHSLNQATMPVIQAYDQDPSIKKCGRVASLSDGAAP